MKYCYKCQTEKPLVEFHRNRAKGDGVTSECKPCHRQLAREEYWRGGRMRQIKSKYSISEEQYRAMVDAQQGGCAICKRPPAPGKNLHVDHNHETGVVRGLLCQNCNIAVGFIEKHYEAAKDYLSQPGGMPEVPAAPQIPQIGQ